MVEIIRIYHSNLGLKGGFMVELFEFIIQTLFLKGGSWLNCSNLSFKPCC